MNRNGAELYLDLMKKVLTNLIYEDPPVMVYSYDEYSEHEFTSNPRHDGRDWPSLAHTMVGLRRLDNLQRCVQGVLDDGVPGDLIETGVWRGGASIFMRSVLKARLVTDRTVWVADSFRGMPEVGPAGHPADRSLKLHEANDVLAVPLETVRDNFRRYDLLDDQVAFLPGWFKDTLPTAPIERLAVIRLDGDLYESTTDALVHLYPKLSPGGFVIVDDYVIPACREAVHNYREEHGIREPIEDIDGTGAFWRRTGV
ncbi:TylF/MycF family methyltransferase [Streptomyces sp. NPDC001262]|uniref:TylF/MycF family methyltransferase n=1 Tax=Streptomyces TaxID=1883 RepID=UPI003685BC30